MRPPIIVTHPSTLFHAALHQLLTKSRFRPVRIESTLSDELETYLRSQESSIWLVGVERCLPSTNALVRRVVTTAPGVKAVILAAYQSPNDIIPALAAGACGFLRQDIPVAQLLKCLELIMLGEVVVHPQFSWGQIAAGSIEANGERRDDRSLQKINGESHLAQPFQSRSTASLSLVETEPSGKNQAGDVAHSLSRREKLILQMLTQGASNKAIALRLVITESTVKVHMKAILRKLRLQNRTQAAMWAHDYLNQEDSCQTPSAALAN